MKRSGPDQRYGVPHCCRLGDRNRGAIYYLSFPNLGHTGEQCWPANHSAEDIADGECCGCLIVRVRGGEAGIPCNECVAAIRTVPVGDVEAAMLEIAQTDTICSVRCIHCGALTAFPRFSTIEAFICSDCGEGVIVNAPVQ